MQKSRQDRKDQENARVSHSDDELYGAQFGPTDYDYYFLWVISTIHFIAMLTKVCFDTIKQNNEKKKDARINKRLINQVSIKPKSHVTALAISKMFGH